MDFVLTHDELNEHMESVGRTVPVMEMKIVGKDGKPCAAGNADFWH
jgi:hypothetical protein